MNVDSRLVKKWKKISGGRPFLLKGIQDPDDARKAMEMGCDGVVCSNHAGRQVDGAIASLDALPDVCDLPPSRFELTKDRRRCETVRLTFESCSCQL